MSVRALIKKVVVPSFENLCAAFVTSVSLWWMFAEKIHHKDTKSTEKHRGN